VAQNKTIYLDYAAATPLDGRVYAAMQPYLTDLFYNPAASYEGARGVREAINQARRAVAVVLGAKPMEVVFTSGGTESNNLAISGVLQQYPDKKVLVSAIEHESVLEPAALYDHDVLPVQATGIINLEVAGERIDDQTVLVSVMLANNEIGSIQPLRILASKIAEIRIDRKKRGVPTPLLLHTDACQAPLTLDISVHRLGVDLLTLNAGKIYGPKQAGALFVATNTIVRPQIVGGHQQRNLRSGTESAAQAWGLAEALKLASEERLKETARLRRLQDLFCSQLLSIGHGITINGSRKKRLVSNVHITIPGEDNERLLALLDAAGICAAAGSACSAGSAVPSHVLRAIGLSDDEARSSLRFSIGRGSTEAQLEQVVKTLRKILR